MVKVRLKDRSFLNYDGTVIEAEMDDSGDVILPEHVREVAGRSWALEDEFEVVSPDIIPDGYTLEVQVKDLLHLQDILSALPESTVGTAILRKN